MYITSCTKPESTYFLPFFIGLSVMCPQSVFYVFGVIEIQRNRFQRVVMHVSIVKERRNVVRWKSTPTSRRNKHRRRQVAIFLQIWTFFENLCGKPFTIINAQVKHSWCNTSHIPRARRVFRLISSPCTLATVSAGRQCIPQLLFQI